MTLPELHLPDWRPTKDTLHLYVRGLTTRRLHHDNTTFQIDFDFVDHALLVRTHDGRVRSFELADSVPVADFDSRLHETLRKLGVDVTIREEPFGLPRWCPTPGQLHELQATAAYEFSRPAYRAAATTRR